jgi:hypothetical protein
LKLHVADRVVVWLVECGHPLCFDGLEQDCFLGIKSETWIWQVRLDGSSTVMK